MAASSISSSKPFANAASLFKFLYLFKLGAEVVRVCLTRSLIAFGGDKGIPTAVSSAEKDA